MHNKKHHIVRKTIIVLGSFVLGIVGTVIAAATYDASIQTRVGSMMKSIKTNASALAPADASAYYTLVHLNIQSLLKVLVTVDEGLLAEISYIPELQDDNVLTQIAGNTGVTSSNTGVTSGNTGVTSGNTGSTTSTVGKVTINVAGGTSMLCGDPSRNDYTSWSDANWQSARTNVIDKAACNSKGNDGVGYVWNVCNGKITNKKTVNSLVEGETFSCPTSTSNATGTTNITNNTNTSNLTGTTNQNYLWSCVVAGPVSVNTSQYTCNSSNVNKTQKINGYDCTCISRTIATGTNNATSGTSSTGISTQTNKNNNTTASPSGNMSTQETSTNSIQGYDPSTGLPNTITDFTNNLDVDFKVRGAFAGVGSDIYFDYGIVGLPKENKPGYGCGMKNLCFGEYGDKYFEDNSYSVRIAFGNACQVLKADGSTKNIDLVQGGNSNFGEGHNCGMTELERSDLKEYNNKMTGTYTAKLGNYSDYYMILQVINTSTGDKKIVKEIIKKATVTTAGPLPRVTKFHLNRTDINRYLSAEGSGMTFDWITSGAAKIEIVGWPGTGINNTHGGSDDVLYTSNKSNGTSSVLYHNAKYATYFLYAYNNVGQASEDQRSCSPYNFSVGAMNRSDIYGKCSNEESTPSTTPTPVASPITPTPSTTPTPVVTPTPTPSAPVSTTPSTPTVSAGQAYLDRNPDVAAAYAANSYGLSIDAFAQTHYNNHGQAEQRVWGR